MAAVRCSICSHPMRQMIDLALAVDGASSRDIARRFGVKKDAVLRHLNRGHIAPKIITAKQVKEVRERDTFQEEHQKMVSDLLEEKDRAKQAGDTKLFLECMDRLIKMHDINGKASRVYSEKVEHSGNAAAPLAWAILTPEEIEREVLQRVNGPAASVQPPESRKKPGKNVEREA